MTVPDSSIWSGTPYLSADGTIVITGLRQGPKRGLVPSSNARALVGNFETGWQDVEMGGIDYPNPPGFPNTRGGGALPRSITLGENGYVAVGRATFFDRDYASASTVAAIWHSVDGLEWQVIDPRQLFGADKLSTLEAVAAVPGGYVAAGRLADSSRKATSIEILGSSDGIDWHKLTSIHGPYTLVPYQLFLNGDELLLTGVQFGCTTDSTDITTFGWAPQQRIWRSADFGSTWDEPDLLASGVITQPEPLPEDPSDCPQSGLERNDRFRTSGSVLGVADGRVFLISAQGDQLAASSDLANWTHYTLPGAIPEGSQRAASRLITGTGADVDVISLEGRRDAETDRALESAWQTIVWRLQEDGSAVRQPAGKPLFDPGTLIAAPGSEVWLWAGGKGIRRSVAGTLVPWDTCTPAPGADCAFAELLIESPGIDLHGIDLRGAKITGGDLTGADLSGALLGDASIDATLDGADLTGAAAAGLDLNGYMSGANFSGADLTDAGLNVTFFDAVRDASTIWHPITIRIQIGQTLEGRDFSGEDLSGVTFTGWEAAPSNMRNVDFSGADLRNASFFHLDLTGADFSGAKLENVYFGRDITCPDGQAKDDAASGKAACRL